MALADLRAMSEARVARVAREQPTRGNTCDGTKTKESCGFRGCVAPVARVAPELGNAGESAETIPASHPAQTTTGLTAIHADRETRAAPPFGAYSDPHEVAGPAASSTALADQSAHMVERLAQAMAATPGNIVTDRDKAMPYFRGMAKNRLAGLNSDMARGLLLGFKRHQGRALRTGTSHCAQPIKPAGEAAQGSGQRLLS